METSAPVSSKKRNTLAPARVTTVTGTFGSLIAPNGVCLDDSAISVRTEDVGRLNVFDGQRFRALAKRVDVL